MTDTGFSREFRDGLCSRGFFEEFSADQHTANLAGAGADFIEFRVAQESPGRIIVHVTIAAQALDRFQRHGGRAFRREQDRAGGVLARRPAFSQACATA